MDSLIGEPSHLADCCLCKRGKSTTGLRNGGHHGVIATRIGCQYIQCLVRNFLQYVYDSFRQETGQKMRRELLRNAEQLIS